MYIVGCVDRMTNNKFRVLGYMVQQTQLGPKWILSAATRECLKLYDAVKSFGISQLKLETFAACRLGKGVSVFTPLVGYDSCTMLWWNSSSTSSVMNIYEYDVSEKLNMSQFVPETWHSVRTVQFLTSSSSVHLGKPDEELHEGHQAEVEVGDAVSRTARAPLPGTLSPIEEEPSILTDETHSSLDLGDMDYATYWAEFSGEYEGHEGISSLVSDDYLNLLSENDEFDYILRTDEPDHSANLYAQRAVFVNCNYPVISANRRAGLPIDDGLDVEEDYVEMHFQGDAYKLVRDLPREPEVGEVVVVRFYLSQNKNTGSRRTVVQRDDDMLTAEETKTYGKEVEAAMLKELLTWAQLKCFSRKLRRDVRNIIDCRWVLKWKWEQATTDVKDGGHQAEIPKKRVIRARLTVRGFKDRQKDSLESYAGTAQRFSQRLLCSVAVQNKWPICTTDISKAFLQGVTYEELARLTGEPLREVNFYLPPGSVPLLKQVPGFESFDPFKEVLHNDKPGTGLVDAPRAFSLKLFMILSKLGLKPTAIDAELCVLHDSQSKLQLIMTKHVDDLKIAAQRELSEWLIGELQKTFGELKISWNTFLNCGVQHTQDPITFEVELHQNVYISALKVISHTDLRSIANDDMATPELIELFVSLVGALAYALLTRIDVAVFIACLQRMSHKLRIIHAKRLNAVVRYCQRNPKSLVYKALPAGKLHIRCVSDAAFRKETDTGHALRGAIYLLCVKNTNEGYQAAVGDSNTAQQYMQGSCNSHIADYACGSEKHVTRSTFSAELFAACGAADKGILIGIAIHEVMCGVTSKEANKKLREEGGFP